MREDNMSRLGFVPVLIFAGVAMTGCATQDYVDKHVAVVQGQVTAAQSHAQDVDAHVAQLDQQTRDAMDRAQQAGKLAEGKFLYQMVLSDDSVKFNKYSAQLSPEAQTRISDFVSKLKADNKNVYVEIQGHSDRAEGRQEGIRLGRERAEAVRLFMSQQGVPLNRMATISYGDTQPEAQGIDKQSRAQNRRVVVIVMS
jgi:outer membrane protein OmpA-like peptidoglycan-associated protein